MQTILQEISRIRYGLTGVQIHDSLSVPLVYTQVIFTWSWIFDREFVLVVQGITLGLKPYRNALFVGKVEKILKDSLDSILSPSPSVKIEIYIYLR